MSYVTVHIYNPQTDDGVWVEVAELDYVEVEPGHEMDPGASVLVPEPWASLIDWSTEEWDEYHVNYELLVPIGATVSNPEEFEPDVTVERDGEEFVVKLAGIEVSRARSLAEAWYVGRDEAELAEYYGQCAEDEAAAERAVERYYEERGTYEVEDMERRYIGGFYEQEV